MSLDRCSNHDLVRRAKDAAIRERSAVLDVLRYLAEIDRRRLYAERGFSSLHGFVVKELGYSDGEAFRRIQAMRLIRALPEAEERLTRMAVTLTSLSILQTFFENEERENSRVYTDEEKRQYLEMAVGKSKREVERQLAEISPKSAYRGFSERPVSATHSEVKFVVDDETLQKLHRIAELKGIRDLARVVSIVASETLERLERNKRSRTNGSRVEPSAKPANFSGEVVTAVDGRAATRVKMPRKIPAALKRAVWIRDDGRCTYVDPITKHKCGSRFSVQIDHIRPFAMGGSSLDTRNLRLLCPAHNQLHAIRNFGYSKVVGTKSRKARASRD